MVGQVSGVLRKLKKLKKTNYRIHEEKKERSEKFELPKVTFIPEGLYEKDPLELSKFFDGCLN